MISQTIHKPWLVQKYGGTSVGKLLEQISGRIVPEYFQDYNLAIVCSARSSTSKSKGTTSLLLDAIRCATSSETNTTALDEVIDTILEDHLRAVDLIQVEDEDPMQISLLQDLKIEIERDCEKLRGFLKAAWTVGEISERTKDQALAVGELLSCRIMAASLKSKNMDAEVVSLSDIVQQVGKENMKQQSLDYKRNPTEYLRGLTTAVRERILNCNGKLPIITGYFGSMPESLLQTIGRGYSDLCAALCAVSLSAQEIQIWKEVDGVFTADPTNVSSARVLATITSEELAELTYYGSEVVHPLTIELLESYGATLRLKNVKRPAASGTVIFPSQKHKYSSVSPLGSPKPMSRSAFMTANGYHGHDESRWAPTAVTSKESVCLLTVTSNGAYPPSSLLGEISQRVCRYGLTIDVISSSRQSISVAVSSKGSYDADDSIDLAVSELEELGSVTVSRNMSIVSVVGHKMRNAVGIAGEIFSTLANARVNIYLISQGANEINISFVVKARDAVLAMEVVHNRVLRIPSQSAQENAFINGPWLY